MTLDTAKADVLYIFDCCYTPVSDQGRNYELLAATEVVHATEAEWRLGPNSFTAKLVNILTTLDGEPATVVQIYALLMREAYLDLKRTFTVAPIHRRKSDRQFAVKLQPLYTSSVIPEFRLHQLLASAPRALIQASVQIPTPGVEVVEWRQFLMDATPRIPSLDITVGAVYQTNDETWIIHLLVSVDVWALLWDHQPALKFVEFVRSGNIRDSLSYIHGPFEKTNPSLKIEDGLAVIKEEKGLVAIKKEDDSGMVAIKKEDDSEMDYASDYIKKEEDNTDFQGPR